MTLKIKVFQTADEEKYGDLLKISSGCNKKYCDYHKIQFETFVGIKRGFHAWHACFNRIVYLKEQIDAGFDGWVFYLDADAYVFEHKLDVRDVINSYQGDFIFSPGGLTGNKWDVNDGIFLINLGSIAGRELAVAWYDNFMSTSDADLESANDWQMVPSDQPRLHHILKTNSHLLEKLAIVPREIFNNESASFARQVLRANASNMEERIAKLREGVRGALSDGISKPGGSEESSEGSFLDNPEQYGHSYDVEYRRILLQYTPDAKNYLEWGSGYTTQMTIEHIGNRAVDLFLTIDENKEYLDKVVEKYKDIGYFRYRSIPLTGPCVDDRDVGLNYSTFPLSLARNFDFIFIDGRRRMECAMMALIMSNENSIIVIHDYRRQRYQPLLALFRIIEDGPQFRVMAPRKTIFYAIEEMAHFVFKAMKTEDVLF